jgi:pimeloyl-ACP methyl ester carboxylesterase
LGKESQVPIVLVHGAMHGAWCWECVIPLLESAGQRVIAIDLPGSDGHMPPSEVTAAAYGEAVTTVLERLAHPALLVGHSMGGLPISLAAEASPLRVSALVYLCAAVPRDGQTLSDTSSDDAVVAEVRSDDNGATFYFDDAYARRVFFGDCMQHASQGMRRLRSQPLRPLHERVRLSPERFGRVPKHYVMTLRDEVIRPERQERHAAALGTPALHRLDCGHSPFYSHPQELAALLCTLAGRI